ncbi:MAG: hypothetical protein IKM97_05030 [Clostridia bacterium]|nr:hypothetical protein [Clostridia bacterium]
MPKKNEEENSEKTVQNFFSKQQIINSKKFALNKDFLNANLDDNKQYTLDEVEEKIKEFKKGKV